MTGRLDLQSFYLGLAALLAGAAVYLFIRPDAAWFLQAAGIQPVSSGLPPWLAGNLPAFTHVFAFSLLTAALLVPTAAARLASCTLWFFCDAAFELGQKYHEVAVGFIPGWFEHVPLLDGLTGYFRRGTFDYWDLAAAAAGAGAAWLLLTLTDHEKRRRKCQENRK